MRADSRRPRLPSLRPISRQYRVKLSIVSKSFDGTGSGRTCIHQRCCSQSTSRLQFCPAGPRGGSPTPSTALPPIPRRGAGAKNAEVACGAGIRSIARGGCRNPVDCARTTRNQRHSGTQTRNERDSRTARGGCRNPADCARATRNEPDFRTRMHNRRDSRTQTRTERDSRTARGRPHAVRAIPAPVAPSGLSGQTSRTISASLARWAAFSQLESGEDPR